MNSPNAFSQKNAIKALKAGDKRIWFFDFNDPKYYRWFELGDEFQAGLIEKGHFEARVKDMLEEGYTE